MVVSGVYAGLAFFISSLVVIFITWIASLILGKARGLGKSKEKKNQNNKYEGGFWDIIRTPDWYPSLSIFQFTVWTFVILFAYLGIYFTRLFDGIFEPPTDFPSNILVLMGISVAVPIASGGVNLVKYASETSAEIPTKEEMKKRGFMTILQEGNKPTLSRLQMFTWTWISIIIYLAVLYSNVDHNLATVKALSLPNIDPALVVLMGLSQGAYLGGKIVTAQAMEITKIQPDKGHANQDIQIFGINFGNDKDTVWFQDKKIGKDDPNLFWTDNRIGVKVPHDVQAGEYTIKVAKGGLLTEGKKFIVT